MNSSERINSLPRVDVTEDGLKEAFDQGLVSARAELTAQARGLVKDPVAADDLVQETYLRAIANRNKFESETNLNAWLHSILKNIFINEYRSGKKHRELAAQYQMAAEAGNNQLGIDSLFSVPEILKTLEELPKDEREALCLIGIYGFSYSEAAVILNAPIGTIGPRVSAAREKLKQLLNPSE